MLPVLSALLAFVASLLRSRLALSLDNLALRHQLAVYKHTVQRPQLRPSDRLFWAWLSRLWPAWQAALAFRPAAHRDRLAEATISRSLATIEPARKARSSCHCQGRS
jgi:hypothetical protein